VVNIRQFDVCRVIGVREGRVVDLAVILQDDALSHLSTRIVAPVIQVEEEFALDRSTVAVTIHGVPYLVAIHLLSTIPRRSLGTVVASIKEMDRQLKNALEMTFFGV
jgi:hypothetical protein